MSKTLVDLRIIKKLTQNDMAKKLDIAVSTYNMYESGKRNIPLKIANRIAFILNVDRNEIFSPVTFTLNKTVNNHYLKNNSCKSTDSIVWQILNSYTKNNFL